MTVRVRLDWNHSISAVTRFCHQQTHWMNHFYDSSSWWIATSGSFSHAFVNDIWVGVFFPPSSALSWYFVPLQSSSSNLMTLIKGESGSFSCLRTCCLSLLVAVYDRDLFFRSDASSASKLLGNYKVVSSSISAGISSKPCCCPENSHNVSIIRQCTLL